jgi:hypothetical protein
MTPLQSCQPAFRSLLLVLPLALLAGACGGGAEPPRAEGTPPATAAEASADRTGGVAFEPAYPGEVSEEGLSERDVEQQQMLHSHDGGEPHTHDEGARDGHSHPH